MFASSILSRVTVTVNIFKCQQNAVIVDSIRKLKLFAAKPINLTYNFDRNASSHCLQSVCINNICEPTINRPDYTARFIHQLAKAKPVPLINISSPKKRVARKKLLDSSGKGKYNVIAFATADGYDLDSLREGLFVDDSYTPCHVISEFSEDLLYAECKSTSEEESKQIFFFQEGAVVFWNIPIEECLNILKFLKQFEYQSYNSKLIDCEQELMPYLYTEPENKSDLQKGVMLIDSEKSQVDMALDKYTFSNALVLSVKLGIWEGILEDYIASIEVLTDDLKSGNKIRISRKDILKKMGELFALRQSINLSSDVLDIPDFYWDREEQEKLYIKMVNYLSITSRTKVVNEKLSYCLELVDLLSSHLNDNHHIRLEWMIIILIMVEVGVEVIHYKELF